MVWCSCPLPNLPWLTSNRTQWSPPAALIFPSSPSLLSDLICLLLNLPPLFPLPYSLCTSQRSSSGSEVREKLSEGSMLVISRHIWYQREIKPALICARAALNHSTHLYMIQSHQTKQHKPSQPNRTLCWKQLALRSIIIITVSVSSHWSTLLISPLSLSRSLLSLSPSLPFSCSLSSLSRSHVAPAFKLLHLQYEEF